MLGSKKHRVGRTGTILVMLDVAVLPLIREQRGRQTIGDNCQRSRGNQRDMSVHGKCSLSFRGEFRQMLLLFTIRFD